MAKKIYPSKTDLKILDRQLQQLLDFWEKKVDYATGEPFHPKVYTPTVINHIIKQRNRAIASVTAIRKLMRINTVERKD
jgi:hypothetical protein